LVTWLAELGNRDFTLAKDVFLGPAKVVFYGIRYLQIEATASLSLMTRQGS
jgi:hypothetical protein